MLISSLLPNASVLIFIIFILCNSTIIFAQNSLNKIFPLFPKYKKGGWFFAPGITYPFPGLKSYNESFEDSNIVISYDSKARGSIRLYLEGGWYHTFTDTYFIHFIDFGIAYKWLRGKEKLNQTKTGSGTKQFNSKFSTHNFNIFFNANNVYLLSSNSFLMNSIGINFDWAFINKIVNAVPGQLFPEFPSNPLVQVHYKIGIAFKGYKKIIIPSIETPILNILNSDNFKSTLPYFKNRYRTIIFSVRIMFLRNNYEKCPPVINPAGI